MQKVDLAEGLLPPNSSRPLTHAEVGAKYDGVIPYSHAQPYYRVASAEDELPSAELQASEKRARSLSDLLRTPAPESRSLLAVF